MKWGFNAFFLLLLFLLLNLIAAEKTVFIAQGFISSPIVVFPGERVVFSDGEFVFNETISVTNATIVFSNASIKFVSPEPGRIGLDVFNGKLYAVNSSFDSANGIQYKFFVNQSTVHILNSSIRLVGYQRYGYGSAAGPYFEGGNINVKNSTLIEIGTALVLSQVMYAEIIGNNFTDPIYSAIHLQNSSNNSIAGNYFNGFHPVLNPRETTGTVLIEVVRSNFNKFANNTIIFKRPWDGNNKGLSLVGNENRVFNNTFIGGKSHVGTEFASNNYVIGNHFSHAGIDPFYAPDGAAVREFSNGFAGNIIAYNFFENNKIARAYFGEGIPIQGEPNTWAYNNFINNTVDAKFYNTEWEVNPPHMKRNYHGTANYDAALVKILVYGPNPKPYCLLSPIVSVPIALRVRPEHSQLIYGNGC